MVLILRGRDEIGSTIIGVMERYNQNLQASGGALFLAGVSPHVKGQLFRTGISSQTGHNEITLVSLSFRHNLSLCLLRSA